MDVKWMTKVYQTCRNIAKNLNRLTRVHERYRQTDDRRQRDGRQHIIANVPISTEAPATRRNFLAIG